MRLTPHDRSRRAMRTGALLFMGTAALLAGAAQAGQQPTAAAHDTQAAADSAGVGRKSQLSDDSAKLLTLAIALKAEVDKTNKDTLSLNVIRKADEIEKLAHSVKEKMRLTSAGS